MKIRTEVKEFSEIMEYKLKENDSKGGWSECEIDWLIERMEGEIDELKNALWKRRNDWGRSVSEGFIFVASDEDIQKECADIANFAMMIADNVKKL